MIAHFRPLLFVFVSLLLGLIAGYVFCYVSSTVFFLSLVLCAVVIVFLLISLAFNKNKLFGYIFSNKKPIICILSCFLIGAATFSVMYNTYTPESKIENYHSYYVVGSVKTNYAYHQTDDYKRLTFFVKDANVLVGDQQVKLDKNLYISIAVQDFDENSPLFNISVNDDIVFNGKFKLTPVFGENFYQYAYKNNFDYTVYLNEDDVVLYDLPPTGFDAVREHIHDTLYAKMTPKYASLAYSVLIGDRTGLDDEIETNLKVSGLGHLIAVSGLHVGFLVALMLLFCKLCRIKKGWIQFLLTTGVLILYCLLCNMTPSVTRATIMAVCLLSAKAFHKQPDPLSSLSLAGIILICMHPLCVFDVSFQLSFAAVCSIILLFPLFKTTYQKLKNKKFLTKACDTINVSLCAQIGTTPYMMYAFGYVSTFSLFANVFVVPLFGIVYMLLFALTLLGCIIPLLGVALYLPELCFVGLDYFSSWVSTLPMAVISIDRLLPVVLLLWAVSTFVVSDKFIAKRRIKLPVVGISLFVTTLVFVLAVVLL